MVEERELKNTTLKFARSLASELQTYRQREWLRTSLCTPQHPLIPRCSNLGHGCRAAQIRTVARM